MTVARRIGLWLSCALLVVTADVITKAVPHGVVATNHARTPLIIYAIVGCFLFALGLWRSLLLTAGAGLMFGALCGNAGQLILDGYATDWIPIGGWLTNVADIAGAIGLVCCFAGYARSMSPSPRRTVSRSPRRR